MNASKEIRCIFFLIFSCMVFSCTQVHQNSICFEDTCIKVEVADEIPEQIKGLQHREHLKEDEGMLFIFGNLAIHDFWMKDTLIPLDIIWLDENKEVVFIAQNVPPCVRSPCPVYGPRKPSQYVLEVNAGYVSEHPIAPGDKAVFHLLPESKR